MSSGGRRHNGSHNGHHNAAPSLAVEHNGHHPPREPRKEENTLVRRSFRRCGDEWRADSRRCVSRDRCEIARCNPFLARPLTDAANVTARTDARDATGT